VVPLASPQPAPLFQKKTALLTRVIRIPASSTDLEELGHKFWAKRQSGRIGDSGHIANRFVAALFAHLIDGCWIYDKSGDSYAELKRLPPLRRTPAL